MMTHKHFQAIADATNRAYALCEHHTDEVALESIHRHYCNELAHMCKRENPAFDRDRFMRACGFVCT